MNIILENTEATFVEKKSKFIASLLAIKDEDDAVNHIENIKKKYYDARHNCYAYIVGLDKKISKSSDDGEPSGTAGRPMLSILEGEKLTNVLIVVTRYFGGILLGTGGLQKAYSTATKLAIEDIKTKKLLKEVLKGFKFSINTPYDKLGKIENYFKNEDGIYILNKNFDESIDLDIVINVDKEEIIKSFFTELFSKDINIEDKVKIYYYVGEKNTLNVI